MKNFFTGLLCLLIVCSCTTENTETDTSSIEIKELENIMYFEDLEDFQETMALFNTFNGNADFENWSNEQDFVSILFSDDVPLEVKNEVPFRFSFILNENMQFQIGNSLITFENDVFYENTIDKSIGTIKDNEVFGTFESTEHILDDSSKTDDRERVCFNANFGEKKRYVEFVRTSYRTGCGTPYSKSLRYRLVHYLISEAINLGGISQADLVFKLRMSQHTSSGWHYNNTTTERLFDVYATGDYHFKSSCNGTPINNSSGSIYINDQNSCYSPLKGTRSYYLGSADTGFGPNNISLYNWDVRLSGSVFHKVNGDTNQVNEGINW